MDLKRFRYFGISVLALILIFVLFKSLNYVENEGFSPTDEGVVIAQSWRIINGEIPHKDFISIRPAVSGYLHTINFIIPGPLVPNARWFVLFQFFMIAAVMSSFAMHLLEECLKKKVGVLYFVSLLLVGFTVTVLNYNLYPWTTIDAVFWSVLALPLIFSEKRWHIALGLLFTSLAALSRQTFAVICLAAFVYVFIKNRKYFVKYILVFCVGAVPFVIYLIMLVANDSLLEFVSHMTGRSEFFETAILQFGKKFFVGLSLPLNLVCLFICASLFFKRKSGLKDLFIQRKLHIVLTLVYLLFALSLVVKHFLKSEIDIYSLPFDLFFMSLFFMGFHYFILPDHKKMRLCMFSVLLISWTSAISLGDNSPIFSAGILFVSLIILCFDVLLVTPSKIKKIVTNQYLLLVIACCVFTLGLYSQPRVNYRDNSYKELVTGLNNSSENFGEIKANTYIVEYYNELTKLYESLEAPKDRTIVFPHNAMFYPLMQTINPAPLDWITANEYIGQEDRIVKDFTNLMSEGKIYFIVEKVDVRIIKNGISPHIYADSDIVYNMIVKRCEILPLESDIFDVYCTVQ